MKPASGRVTTYLDFGMTQGGRRTSYDYYEGQHAYDLFMGARYLHDLIAYRTGDVEAVFHPEDLRDTLRKHTALSVCAPGSPRLTYYEIGSSVFGAIDAIAFMDRRYDEIDTRRVTWQGVDNSTFMNHMALYTHPGHDLRLAEVATPVACDLFFAKGVSLLYALEDEARFCEILDQSRIAIFDYTFSHGDRIVDVVGTGLPVTFLSLDACLRRMERPDRRLLLEPYTIKTYHQDPRKVTYDCIYGDPIVVDAYLSKLHDRSQRFESDWERPVMRAVPARVSST